MKKILACAVVLFLAPIGAYADDAPAASAPTVQDSLAPPGCEQPALPAAEGADHTASRLHKSDDKAAFNAKFQAYRDCMKAYTDGQGELAKKHIAAANAAVKAVNDYIAALNEAQGGN